MTKGCQMETCRDVCFLETSAALELAVLPTCICTFEDGERAGCFVALREHFKAFLLVDFR